MNVRTKMIAVLAPLFALTITVEIIVQQRVLMPNFAQLERDDARTAMKRVEFVFQLAFDRLGMAAADWGNWIDVYRFVQAPTGEFLDTNITPVALKQLQINALLIVDRDGNVVAAKTSDPQTGEPLDLDLAAHGSLPADFPWRRQIALGTPARGLLRTKQGIMMLAAGPVLNGSGGGPPSGMVIMGKLLTSRQLRAIGEEAQADFWMTPAREVAGDRLVETDGETEVFRPYADIYGRPLMSFEVALPRRISENGRGALTYASMGLIIAGLSALGVVVLVLSRVVLEPLARVTRHAVRIGEGTDLTARLDLPARDEVGVLAREFDRMVARVAESRRELMDQSFQAGFAELAKGVLHNLGNAMTPLGVRLSTLEGRLRAAPGADLEFAATELAAEDPGSSRHADLQEFLRLGCRQMRAALEDAQADLTVIQRQTVVVQTALVELMSSARNDHVVESVRLPELVSQTLEIVPDSCRQALVIEADESLRRVGVVQVARTVLRLVLQNLIINAADAVRVAGRERGVLKVAAEIVREADQDQLHLRCDDNGAGIAQADLVRVFDKGFTTKPRETNHGIGLHWCANAIAGLGGRIWAASEGPGCGASLHLMLPLNVTSTASHS